MSSIHILKSVDNAGFYFYEHSQGMFFIIILQIVTASYTDLQDYTYYFVPAPWLSVKLLRLLQHYPPPDDPGVRGRLNECLDTILNKAQEPPKSKKVFTNADNTF